MWRKRDVAQMGCVANGMWRQWDVAQTGYHAHGCRARKSCAQTGGAIFATTPPSNDGP